MSRRTTPDLVALMTIAIVTTANAQGVRVFMAPDGEQGSVPTTGNTTVYVAPGADVSVSIWIEDTDQTQELNSFQIILHWEAIPQPGATGLVDYVDISYSNCLRRWT